MWFHLLKRFASFCSKSGNDIKEGNMIKSLRRAECLVQPGLCHLMVAVLVGALWKTVPLDNMDKALQHLQLSDREMGFIRASWPDHDHILKKSWAYYYASCLVFPMSVNHRTTCFLQYLTADRHFLHGASLSRQKSMPPAKKHLSVLALEFLIRWRGDTFHKRQPIET